MATAAEALAAAVRSAPTASVACYSGWTLVDLGEHVGQIHRWAAGVVEQRATERPTGGYAAAPDVASLPAWIITGAQRLADLLAAADPDQEVWTFSPTDRTIAFWRRRMALETALHRWDAEDALGQAAVVEGDLALEGVEEALHVYIEPRLDGRDVGGSGERVAFVPHVSDVPDGEGEGWTLTLHPDHVEVDPGHDTVDAAVRGSALDLWLLLTCRSDLAAVEVAGDTGAAALAVRAAHLVPGPAG